MATAQIERMYTEALQYVPGYSNGTYILSTPHKNELNS
jgi:hypothetical protein